MPELVRAVIGDQEVNVSAAYAQTHDLTVLDEPTRREDGRRISATRRGGRRAKPKMSVDEASTAKKKAAAKSAETAETDNPPSKES